MFIAKVDELSPKTKFAIQYGKGHKSERRKSKLLGGLAVSGWYPLVDRSVSTIEAAIFDEKIAGSIHLSKFQRG